jgi:hypothetical protein
MKKIVLSCLLVWSVTAISAQSATLVNPMTNVEATAATLTSSGEMVAEWPVANLTSNSISIKCLREELNLVAGTQNYFCWGVCYGETTTVSVLAQNIAPGDTNDTFYAHYKPLGNVGQSDINYCFFNTLDPTDRACHTVHYCFECLVSVEDEGTVNDSFGLFGENPLVGMGIYTYQLPQEGGYFSLYDQNGKLILQRNLKGRSGQILLNSKDLNPGVFIGTIQAPDYSSNIKIVVE